MADGSSIQWCDATPSRLVKTAAAKVGVPVDEYVRRRAAGEKWCSDCRSWRTRAEFNLDASRGDGLAAKCRECQNARGRSGYTPRPRPVAGSRRFAAPRDGDKSQANHRVNYLVACGVLPRPASRPCVDCGHTGGEGRRHEYDHHLGYAAGHHEHVEVVCSRCHHRREHTRRLDSIARSLPPRVMAILRQAVAQAERRGGRWPTFRTADTDQALVDAGLVKREMRRCGDGFNRFDLVPTALGRAVAGGAP